MQIEGVVQHHHQHRRLPFHGVSLARKWYAVWIYNLIWIKMSFYPTEREAREMFIMLQLLLQLWMRRMTRRRHDMTHSLLEIDLTERWYYCIVSIVSFLHPGPGHVAGKCDSSTSSFVFHWLTVSPRLEVPWIYFCSQYGADQSFRESVRNQSQADHFSHQSKRYMIGREGWSFRYDKLQLGTILDFFSSRNRCLGKKLVTWGLPN